MRYELFDYQREAVEKLVHQIRQRQAGFAGPYPEHSALILAAPTGAGKTVIATAVMEHLLGESDILDESEGRTVLWVTDDKSLNQQTLQKMLVASDQWFTTTLIESGSFDQETFERRALYFMNTQAASSTTRLANNSDTQSYPIWETIANTVKKLGKDFIVIIDEAHRGTQLNRDAPTTVAKIIDGTPEYGHERVPVVIGISATAQRFETSMRLNFSNHESSRIVSTVTVNVQDVKDSGIIKDKVVLFSPHEAGSVEADTTLMRLAVQRVKDYENRWVTYSLQEGLEKPVKPVLVVQVENGASDDQLGTLAGIVREEWPGIEMKNMVNVFGEHTTRNTIHGNINYIEPHLVESQSDVRVVFAKDAITTGWDCPRAEVLISFRTAEEPTYIAQLIGRIVRQPLARRIMSDESLNGVYCVLPNFNGKQVSKVAGFFNEGPEGTEALPSVVTVTVNNAFNEDLLIGDLDTEPEVELEQVRNEVKAGHATTEQVDRAIGGNAFVPSATDVPPAPETTPNKGPATEARRPDKDSNPAEAEALPATAADLPGQALPSPSLPQKQTSPKRPKSLIAALESMPTYTIPNRPAKGSHIARLHKLAALLSGSKLQPEAKKAADNQLHAFLDGLAKTKAEELDKRVEAIATVVVGSKVFTTDGQELVGDLEAQKRNVRLDEHNIDGVFKEVSRLHLRDGLADSYWKAQTSDEDSDVLDAKIRIAALGSMPEIAPLVEARAEQLVDEWLDRFKLRISELGEKWRKEFQKLIGETRRPSEGKIVIPNSISTDLSDSGNSEDALSKLRQSPENRYTKHIFSDPGARDGTFYTKLSPWEDKIIRAEIARDDTVAWYRNTPRGGEKSLCIPYETVKDSKKTYAGMYPDFIVLRKEETGKGSKLWPVIIDPHGHHLPDSSDKLRGLIAYAEKHGAKFKAIYPIAYDATDKKSRAIPLHLAEVREAVLADLDAGMNLVELYRKHGGQI
ncbi:DEAD/DEAH box helicase family protein [Arthrobacter sp. FW306-06-A]|uniref:DEAD/DEAH box helicase family protein n=1 Tax=Arthrobacter sp. FW306-06-A TaxID=2879621 RepID=UPI001F37784B|nr:DEAD/DEAH box helicase family protein [Arthrobacter sp. FW306-06-A]UKA73592.1 DEAD/DEAH box helicase family protein [Arthrobacter sp. FW306-06-A]